MTFDRFTTLLLFGLAISLAHAAPVFAHSGPALLAETDSTADDDRSQTLTGTVLTLVVDNPIRGTSSRQIELQLDDGALVPLRGDASDALVPGARVAVSGRHNGAWLEVASVQTLAAPANATKADTEVDGTFAVLHADDFVHGKSSFIYELHQSSGKVSRLRLGALPAALAPGMRLRVTGRAEADGESITAEHITVLAEPTSAIEANGAIAKAATSNSVLVITANFNNTAAPAFGAAQAQQVMTSNSDSVANFFREASYGQQLMNVTVTPSWVTMNLARPASCNTSDWQNIGIAAEAAAKTLGAAYDPAGYKFVVYVFPTVSACGWLGLAYIGNPHKAWINGTESFYTSAIAHEMGHNFGLLHAASLRCGSAVIGGSCTASEYGDPFDTMGNQRAMHYNAMQKSKLGWIASTAVQTYAGGPATYTLTPLELAGGTTYAVKIPTASSSRTYWLEFRQPIGFDSPLSAFPNNGAQIRVSSPFETLCLGCDSFSDDTELLDATPATTSFTDATLVAGNTFSDPTYGINVTVVSASASAMTVQVSNGPSPPAPPSATTTTLAASPNPAIVGSSMTFVASVSGSGPTGTVQFTADGATIAGCAAAPVSAGNATCATNSLAAGTHAIVAKYAGDSTNAASTSAALSAVVNVAPDGSMNVALASNGGVVSASSTHSAGFSPAGANDGLRSGAGWGISGGWNDATSQTFPDWLQVNFNGTSTIDHVVVYSVQDNYQNPVEPTDSMTFSLYGLTSFDVQAWNGSDWVTLASVRGNNLVKRTVSFPACATDRIRIYILASADGIWSRITEVEAWSVAAPPQMDVALASNGATATASSTHSPGFSPTGTIDGIRSGAGWGVSGGWNDATSQTFPDWLQINFNGTRTIDRVVVYSVQDNYQNPIEPTDSMTFSLYGLTSFDVQAWNGSDWVTLASVRGNNLVKRTVSFPAYATDRIRIYILASADGIWSRITEVEAWSVATLPQTDVALASNGAAATASSTYSPGFSSTGTIDGIRSGAGWGVSGGWNDATSQTFPDWLQINFNGTRTIDRVVVYSVQDNYQNPVEPTDSMTFSLYGLTSFDVQAWNGSTWATLASVSGNNLVKRTVSFAAYATDRIRIYVTGSQDSLWSRITEVEAWGN